MNLKISLLGNPLSDALFFCGRQSFESTMFFYVEFTPLSSLIQMLLPECGLPEAPGCSSPRPTPQVYKKGKGVGSFSLALLSLSSWLCLLGAWTSLTIINSWVCFLMLRRGTVLQFLLLWQPLLKNLKQ